MNVDFVNCPVNIAGYDIYASEASVSVQIERKALRQHGRQGNHGQVPQGRIAGSVSVSYPMTNGDTGIRQLTGINVFDMSIGPFQCYSGVMSSYNIEFEPYSVINCSATFEFYGGYDQTGVTGSLAATGDFNHGGETTVSTNLLWNNDIIGGSYNISQGIEPRYKLGELIPHAYKRTNGTISTSLRGTGFGRVLSSPCEGFSQGQIDFTGLCDTASNTINFSGMVVNPSISINANDEIVGSLDIFDVF